VVVVIYHPENIIDLFVESVSVCPHLHESFYFFENNFPIFKEDSNDPKIISLS